MSTQELTAVVSATIENVMVTIESLSPYSGEEFHVEGPILPVQPVVNDEDRDEEDYHMPALVGDSDDEDDGDEDYPMPALVDVDDGMNQQHSSIPKCGIPVYGSPTDTNLNFLTNGNKYIV